MRLSYPEAEVMISLSSNVFKGGFGLVNNGQTPSDKRIIDSNELIASRLEKLNEILRANPRMKESGEGFVQGINAEDVSELLSEGDESTVLKSETINPDNVLQQAKDKASELISDAKKQADTIVAEAIEQAELSKKNIMEEARMNGYREGMNRATKEINDTKSALAKQKADMEAEYEAKYESMESDLVNAITNIYEHIFNVELSSNREILVYLINTTLRKVEGGRNFIVHVSKEDYPFVSSQKKQLVTVSSASNTVDVVEDLNLTKGECFIETDGGIFDCGLGTQLKQLSNMLKMLSFEN
ncbi:MAG: hypothetical protein IKK33_12255 [Lachnospiraceae bacterium]|nr:hypothetical protein [Lachnospiraceae bacterium]